jgi:hypothetical protein
MQHQLQACIDACLGCAQECDNCAKACMIEPDAASLIECVRWDRDCADMCRLAVNLMRRDSHFLEEVCRLCGEFCNGCADECAKHDHDHCQRCAEACRQCAEECYRMSGVPTA